MLKTALQLYSIRDNLDGKFAEVMQELADMGYDGVELAGTYGLTAQEMKEALDAAGLPVVSAHIPFVELTSRTDFYIEYFKTIGCVQAVIPYMDRADLPGGENFASVEEQIRRIAKQFSENGIALAYHNHDFEFDKVDGEYILDRLYEIFDPAVLQTQIDTCWVNVGGEDPAAYVRKYAGRCPTVHLKDFVGIKNGCPYALIGREDHNPDDVGTFEFRPCGSGVQDFAAITAAAEQAGAKWQIVEQDQPSMGKSALECAQMSIQYLKGLGK